MYKPLLFACALFVSATLRAQSPQIVLDINPGLPGSFPFNLKELNGQLIFQAYEPVHGRQVWVSDGTAAGTNMLKELVSNQFSYGIFSPFFQYSNFAFIWARDGVQTSLWRTDASSGGTQPLFSTTENADDLLSSRTTSRGLFAVRKDPFSNNIAPFLSDGTENGSGFTGWEITNAFASSSVILDSLYYLGYTGVSGDYLFHLYQSDGTQAGTRIHLPNAGEQNFTSDRRPGQLMNLSGRLGYVLLTDTIPFDGYDQSLWVAGFPPVSLLPHQQFGYTFGVANQKLYFEAPTHPDSVQFPLGLYAFDGIDKNLLLSYTGDFPFGNEGNILDTTGNGSLVFRENRVAGSRLWLLDGTPSGSKLIFDPQNAGFLDSTGVAMARHIPGTSSIVFQTANSNSRIHRFWAYDINSGALNQLFQFVSTAADGANLQEWLYYDNAIFFTADDGLSGTELWRFLFALTGTGTPNSTQQQCPVVWPNPCGDMLHIRLEPSIPAGAFLRVVNTQGRQVFNRRLQAGGDRILIDHLPAGLYFYSITGNLGEAISSGKLLKQ